MHSSHPLVLVFDVGTQSTRALLFDLHGNLIEKTKHDEPPYISQNDNRAEKDPAECWQGICTVSRELKNIAEACSFNGPHIKTSYLRSCFDSSENENESNEDYETLRIPKDASLDTVSSIYIKKLLSVHNIKEVCQISGLSRSSLWRKQNKLLTDKNN